MMKKLIVSLISCLMFSSVGLGASASLQDVNVRSITSGVKFTVTWTGGKVPVEQAAGTTFTMTWTGGKVPTYDQALNTWASAVPYVSNTVYIVSATTSPTGAGWIDCRGLDSITFSVAFNAKNDSAAVIGAGVTIYVDASNEIYTNLPTLTAQPFWNMWRGKSDSSSAATLTSLTSQEVIIPNPPASLRWRLTGVFNATVSVMYHAPLRK